MNKKNIFNTRANTILFYLLSFFIPLLIMGIFFYESKIFPFGDYSYLDGDLYYQYMPFLYSLKNKLDNHSSFEYTWNMGLGTGYQAIYAYYLASPTNWILTLVNPEHIIDFTNIVIAIKLSLCGLTFFHYIRKKYNTSNILGITLSLCYSLSSYMCAYCSNIIWLDGLLLFPIIILAIDIMYQNNKHILYFFTLSFSIFSNYYISIIICLFCLLYFLSLVIFNDENKTRKERLIFTKNFFVYSLLAGMVCAIIIIPAAFSLSSTSEEFLEFPTKIEFYIPTWDLLMRSLIVMPKTIKDSFPNLYCSVIVLITLPAYLLNGSISIRTKLRNLTLILFMLISFNCNILDFIWHGFHFPNNLCSRNSFIYIFLILTITFESLCHLHNFKKSSFYISLSTPIIFLLFTWKFKIVKSNTLVLYKEKIIYLSLFFIIVYSILLLIAYNISKSRNIIYLLLLLVIGYELYLNGGAIIGSTHCRSSLINQVEANKNLLSKTENANKYFYRVADANETLPINSGTINSYKNISLFSSTANNNVKELYKSLGMETFTNYYSFVGHTPVTSTLFGIKYILNNSKIIDESLLQVANHDNSYLYEYKYAGNLGFMVDESFEHSINLDEVNPFTNLNSIYKNITKDNKDIFTSIDVNSGRKEHSFIVTNTGKVYFKYSTSPYDLEVNITPLNGEKYTRIVSYSRESFITYLGVLEKGDHVTIKLLDDNNKYDYSKVYACMFNENKMDNLASAINSSALDITSYDDTSIKGSINVSSKGLLFTTIPFDKGWSAYVDGKKIEIKAFKGAFISIPLDSGKHTIYLKYNTVHKNTGIIVSLISMFIFIILEIYTFQSERMKKTVS